MKNVIISVKGLVGTDQNGDNIELVTDGTYDIDGERVSFKYMESELTGMEGAVTAFEVEPGLVTITRTGTVAMQMIFKEGEKHYFVYNTPYGAMNMSVDTQSILCDMNEDGGKLEVKYAVDVRDTMLSRNAFEINIREA